MDAATAREERRGPPAFVAVLRSPRLALGILGSGAAYCGAAAWAPWSLPGRGPPPPWAVGLGLDHPFVAWPFLACVALLFASTLACTWGRRARIRALARGELPPSAVALAGPADARSFLEARGFRGRADVLRRFGWALWGGWVLHVGLLVLMAAVLVQQAFQDTAAFDLAEGELARLSDPRAVIGRERGLLAPASPPDLEVALQRFDPFRKQDGYAPDRLSRVAVARPGEAPRVAEVDRAAGTRAGDVEIFQAVPTGIALVVQVSGMGTRSIHLQRDSARAASARLEDPAGRPARLLLQAERPVEDRLGTGALRVELEQDGRRLAIEPGVPFAFGGREARVVSFARWARFTYSRSPGLSGVFAGFALVVAGCALLAFPASVARLDAGGATAARVFLVRGREVLLAEWRREGGAP